MAANLAGMAFVPYYNHIVKVLETDEDLKKSVKGNSKRLLNLFEFTFRIILRGRWTTGQQAE